MHLCSLLVAALLVVVSKYDVEGTFAKNVRRIEWPRARSASAGRHIAKTSLKQTHPDNNQDYYDFVSDGDKRNTRPVDDNYFEFLTGEKKTTDLRSDNDAGYWGFLNGEGMPRKRIQRAVKGQQMR